MNAERFLALVEELAWRSAIDGTIQNYTSPPGRRPWERLVRVSEWRSRMTDDEKKLLDEVIKESTRGALFGLFAMIDGVRKADNDIRRFVIYAQDEEGRRVPINDDGKVDFHDYFAFDSDGLSRVDYPPVPPDAE